MPKDIHSTIRDHGTEIAALKRAKRPRVGGGGGTGGATTAVPHDHTTESDGGKLTGDRHDSYSSYDLVAAPANPPAGQVYIYAATADGHIHQIESDGTDTDLTDTGSSPDASLITYTPADATDWTGSADPGNVDDALDQLADRLAAVQAATVLVGAATGGFSAEIVVGTSPNGELGGSWTAITVDATHSGSSHADVAAYADGILATHAGASDPHAGYRLESADHSHQTTGLEAGQIDHGAAITGLADDDHTQYLLASAATDRATFSTNWTDLTDGGATTLHSHAGSSYTNEDAQDAVGGILTDTATIDFTYNDGANTITADVLQAALDHGTIGGLTDDDHVRYVNLAGRAGGQTIQGDTAAAGNLTLAGTAHATPGMVQTNDTFYLTGTLTATASHRFILSDRTVTLDFASSIMAGIGMSPTIKYKQAGGLITMVYGYLWNPTVQNDANVTPGPLHSFVDDTTLHTITNALTLTEFDGFRSHQQITAASGGTMDVTSWNFFRAQMRALASGSRVRTMRGFLYENAISSGTIDTQIAVDIEALTSGTANIGIRTASATHVNSGSVINFYSDTSTTLLASVSATTGIHTGRGFQAPTASYTASATPFVGDFLTTGTTVTLDFASAAWRAFGARGTIKYKQAGSAFGMYAAVQNVPTIINDASVSVNPGPIYAVNDSPTITVDTATGRTLAEYITVLNNATISRTNSGTMTVTDIAAVDARLTFGAGITVTNRRGLYFRNATSTGAAGFTTQVALDIEALTGATNNFGIRNADRSVQTKYARFGAVTAPSNITDGDVNVVRLFVGADAAFTTGVTAAELVGRSRIGGTDSWLEFANVATIGNIATPAASSIRVYSRLNGDLAGATNLKTLWAKDENAFESAMMLRGRTEFPKPVLFASSVTTQTLPGDNTTAWISHIQIRTPIKVNQIHYNAVSGGFAGNKIRIAIYSENGQQRYIDATDTVGTSTGVRTIDITDTTLAGGNYLVLIGHATFGTTPNTIRVYSVDTQLTAHIASEPDLGGTLNAGSMTSNAPATIDPTALTTVAPDLKCPVIRLLGTALGS